VIKTIEPESISDGEDGPVADFGQNLTGWVELDVSNASAGDEITIRHAEELHEDGSLALVDLRAADATDTYVASGEETGPYQPRFTYHGFRYAQVTGYPGDLGADDLRAHVVHTDMDRQGTFECSNEDLSQVQRNAVWGLRGNAHSVPTDCPQRDERYGWTGDGHISARAFMYNFDSVGFHEKWTRDHDDAQSEHGYVGDTVPYGYGTIPADPNWSITRVTIPWYLYRHYGDRAVLERHYEAMRRYVDYWQGVSDDGIVPSEYANYGDWLTFENADGRRGLPFELFNTAFQYRTTDLFARIAAVLSREADAARYDDRAAHVRDRFNEVFFDPDSATYGPGTQSSYAVPLFFGLVPDEHEDTVVSGLVEKVRRDGRKLKTGFLGSRPLLHTLVDHGHADLAYEIVSQPEQPGWVYMVRNGATTMWERWDSDDRVGSGMNSYNHSPFTFVSEWLFGSLAGLDLEMADGGGSGDRSTVEVAPAIVDDLDWVRARVETVNGPLGCEWARDDGVTATVTIPWNTTGSVSLPTGDGATVTEGGTPIRESDSAESLPPGISAARRDGNWLVLTVGSGTYEFAVEH
jgi:alpha-L-rhamnosidase